MREGDFGSRDLDAGWHMRVLRTMPKEFMSLTEATSYGVNAGNIHVLMISSYDSGQYQK
jgi:hypothetical protein